MRGFGSGSGAGKRRDAGGDRAGYRRAPGAKPMKTARSTVPVRPPDAALGRTTRSLVGPSRRSAGSTRQRTGDWLRVPRLLFRPARAAALLGMLASGFLFTFVTGPTAFGLARTDLPVLQWTDPEAVRAALNVPDGANVFRFDTAPLVAALRALPGVASAEVSVQLPDAVLVVRIDERVPVLAWQVGHTSYIADREGVIFAIVADGGTAPAGIAVIQDRRAGAGAGFAIGSRIDPIDLDVATRLGSLTPTQVGSAAASLRVAITDDDGFIVSVASAWTAVFGFYSPETRSTDMIPGQVRLLRSLLDGREATLARIILASATDGTYVPRATPKPTPR